MTWSYRGGDWFGIFGANAVVALPPSEKARVAALWELVDEGADFDETLDAVISPGLRGLPGFLLLSRKGDQTRVVLRGEVAARFSTGGEVVHVGGDPEATWVERTLAGVSGIHLEVSDESAPGDLALSGGLVRIASAEWAADVPDSDHDGLTRSGAPAPHRTLPGLPGQPPAPPVSGLPVTRLVFSSGEAVDVDRAVLVGRAPDVREGAEEETRLVRVPSPHHEISSTHLEVRPGSGAYHGAAVVTDLGSTNGTILLLPGLPPEDLKAGIAAQLVPGAVIDLGDGATIWVIDP